MKSTSETRRTTQPVSSTIDIPQRWGGNGSVIRPALDNKYWDRYEWFRCGECRANVVAGMLWLHDRDCRHWADDEAQHLPEEF